MAKQVQTQGKKRDRIGMILYSIYILFLLAAAVILIRIVHIQLFYKPDPAIADFFRPRSVKEELEPLRGAILAHDGRLLAMSTPMYQAYMDWTVQKEAFAGDKAKEKEWRDKAKALSRELAGIWRDKSADEYYNQIISGRESGKKFMRIGRQVDHETLQQLKSLPLWSEGKYKGGLQYGYPPVPLRGPGQENHRLCQG